MRNPSADARRRGILPWAIATLAALTVLTVFPPLRIHRLAPAASASLPLDPVSEARRFWATQLLPAGAQAPEAGTVLAEIVKSGQHVASRFGHRFGLGGQYFYLVRGVGSLGKTGHNGVWLQLDGSSAPSTFLVTGPVFGNAIRDASGLSQVERMNSLEANSFSAELNRIAETEIQPKLLRMPQGTRLSFAGCAVAGTLDGQLVLKVTPISVEAL